MDFGFDMFNIAPEITDTYSKKQISNDFDLTSATNSYANCASNLEKPNLDRGESTFVGLDNQ